MHLKRVEMENFKSFGQQMEVPFQPGFTAITGPNGSGKSNIADAVLFVLSPRSSRKMRAGNLKDLIFNGGKDGKPAEECKVTLVFDNEDRTMPVDEDEVRLTRRVKLSPSDPDDYYSYYYVNGRSSKRSEFQDLLSHARISPDGYNIVQQGDIGQIVEMSAIERREILDDIAGITKFDADIEQANEEREEVEDNLERLNIILDETERRMEELDEERERAQRYRKLQDKLSTAELKLAIVRRDELEAKKTSLESTIEEMKSEKSEMEDQLDDKRDELKEAKARFEELEDRLEELGGDEFKEIREERKETELAMWQARDKARDARAAVQDHKETKAEKEQVLGELRDELEETRDEIEELEDELGDKRDELGDKESELDEVNEQLEASDSEAGRIRQELTEMKERYGELQDDLHETRLERDRVEDKVERAARDIAEMEEQLETHEFEIRDIEYELDELRETSAGNRVSELEDQLQGKKKEERELEQALQDLEPKIRELSQTYSQLKAEKEAREKVQQGFTRAVEAVLEARDKGELDGIEGAIAELGSTDDDYETAVATAAGGRLQCIVVETDEHAQAAIEYLKERDLGRATFLPLSKMSASRPRGKARMAERTDEAVGFALDLVDYDEAYEAAFWYVFGDTVVMDDLDAAREHMGGARMVTLDGELVEASGAMTGGSSKNQRLTLGAGTDEDLDEVAEKLREANERQEELGEQLQAVREEIATLEDDLDAAKDEAEDVEDRIADLEMRKRDHEGKIEPLEDGLEKRREEKDAAEDELADLEDEIEELEAEIEDLDKQREAKSKALSETADDALSSRREELKADIEELREAIRDLESKVETERERIELDEERAEEIEEQLADLERTIEENEQLAEDKEKEREELATEVESLEEMEAEYESRFEDVQAERDEALEAKKDVANEIDKLEDKIETQDDMILQKKTRLPELEQELADVAVEINQREDEAEELTPVEADLDHLKDQVKTFEAKIESMGNINMKAIEEYEEARDRAEELTEQIERLEEQRQELIKVVEEITKKKKDGLYEVLSHIDENFQRLFGELSDGGDAEISLEHPDEPFEGGLVIKAQPPGKTVHRLEALSGGERALTSMAFIFAIQEYMPSPFYVLDEIDQNLDAVNAEKVAQMIADNSRHAQFIIVSLRKVTLKEADHVYGVTMNRPGISDVVGNVNVDQVSEQGEFAKKAGVTP